eukprot:7088-Chlamydomonas_euryale.AAC.2
MPRRRDRGPDAQVHWVRHVGWHGHGEAEGHADVQDDVGASGLDGELHRRALRRVWSAAGVHMWTCIAGRRTPSE